MPDFYIRTSDQEVERMLKQLAEEDMRSISMEVAWLIRQEWARRYSQPNPAISVADAMLASEEVKKGE
ncbi:hypothetical protein BECAL_01758 [Bellilinea caldifistulae]|uniref:Uncharacterized protein n=1 Tax=Bellilinea caldifistulae TaxID=360411 RepID=A0A0P6XHI2_9CHLR|nr:hypothetical protein [Bellilinea caldifistulae]KPL74950.1 hypothetical protein AC812_10570 [Bellilinea caldifistulae]GAP10585.1 hypothetical protein BECAL_01758 [Bellilinea caldifistulae]